MQQSYKDNLPNKTDFIDPNIKMDSNYFSSINVTTINSLTTKNLDARNEYYTLLEDIRNSSLILDILSFTFFDDTFITKDDCNKIQTYLNNNQNPTTDRYINLKKITNLGYFSSSNNTIKSISKNDTIKSINKKALKYYFYAYYHSLYNCFNNIEWHQQIPGTYAKLNYEQTYNNLEWLKIVCDYSNYIRTNEKTNELYYTKDKDHCLSNGTTVNYKNYINICRVINACFRDPMVLKMVEKTDIAVGAAISVSNKICEVLLEYPVKTPK
jgi:hypothetical protein